MTYKGQVDDRLCNAMKNKQLVFRLGHESVT